MTTFNGMPAAIRVSKELGRRATIPRIGAPIGRIGRQVGGVIPDSPSMPFSGPLHSDVAGRTDHIPSHVPSGSYVIPADIVSSVGQGNSLNGLKVLQKMFAASPRNASPAPWGGTSGPYGAAMPRAAGGVSPAHHGPVPVMLAGGEFVIHPEDVARIGGGDIKRGHKILDTFVKSKRADTIKTLKNLPNPAVK